MILEEGKREEFKRCLLDSIETLQYPCGHTYIFVHGKGPVQEAIPLSCQRCSQQTVFFTDLSWGTAAINGITYTHDTINVDMLFHPVMPVERINIDFTITGDGVVIQDGD